MKVTLRIDYLPDLSTVGGNAWYAHPMARHRVMAKEKEAWAWRTRAALNALGGRTPRFAKATASVKVVFFTERRRDFDNLTIAFKPMWDSLVAQGVLVDDNAERLTVRYEIGVDRKNGGWTEVTLEGPLEGEG